MKKPKTNPSAYKKRTSMYKNYNPSQTKMQMLTVIFRQSHRVSHCQDDILKYVLQWYLYAPTK